MKIIDENIIIGQNASENWKIIDNCDPDDIWFHLKSLPSPHVVCSDVSKLEMCAKLCVQYSKYKNFKHLKIIYTNVGNLCKGNNIGSVYFKCNKKVKVYSLVS